MSKTNLKPCPFCGAPGEHRTSQWAEDAVDYWVQCTGCGASTQVGEGAYGDRSAVAFLWNKRVSSKEGD